MVPDCEGVDVETCVAEAPTDRVCVRVWDLVGDCVRLRVRVVVCVIEGGIGDGVAETGETAQDQPIDLNAGGRSHGMEPART